MFEPERHRHEGAHLAGASLRYSRVVHLVDNINRPTWLVEPEIQLVWAHLADIATRIYEVTWLAENSVSSQRDVSKSPHGKSRPTVELQEHINELTWLVQPPG